MENPASSSPVTRKSSPNRTVLYVCASVALVMLCLCLILAAACVAFFIRFGGTPEGLTLRYDLPYTARVGDDFELVLYLGNTSNQPIHVSDIYLDRLLSPSILDGAIVLSSDPSMERDYSVSGIKQFAYDTTIPPAQTRTVRFKLRAMKAGEFTGGIGAYVGDLSQEVYPAITILP